MSPAGPSTSHPGATKSCDKKCIWKPNITPGDGRSCGCTFCNFPSKLKSFFLYGNEVALPGSPMPPPLSATDIWASHLSPVPSHQLHVNANHRENKHVLLIFGFYLMAKTSYKSVSASVFFLMASSVLTSWVFSAKFLWVLLPHTPQDQRPPHSCPNISRLFLLLNKKAKQKSASQGSLRTQENSHCGSDNWPVSSKARPSSPKFPLFTSYLDNTGAACQN